MKRHLLVVAAAGWVGGCSSAVPFDMAGDAPSGEGEGEAAEGEAGEGEGEGEGEAGEGEGEVEAPIGVPSDADPVTTALVGSHTTYNVGPGQTYEDPDTVPWGALVAGDVVNIFHRDAPYPFKLCLRAHGTADAPVIVNGVTDGSGQRPRFAFDGARTPQGCNPGGSDDIFDTSSAFSLEDYAGLIIRRGVADAIEDKPRHIHIRNLELSGARPDAQFVNLLGDTVNYDGSPAGIWLQPSADVVLENNVIFDNGFGVFTMAKNDSIDEACERIIVRNNRVFENGIVGSFLEHNVYMQSTNPVVEGNFIGITRAGSEGSSYKSRSSGEIFRYNVVVASARAIDWVHAEEQTPGIGTAADYGTDYAYGNIVINDCSYGNCAGNPIHYGGDNLSEQESVEDEFVPGLPYRRHLYFYANTYIQNMDDSDSYRVSAFDLSERSTLVEAWDNIFSFSGDANYSWVEEAGQVHLVGTNLAFGSIAPGNDRALDVNFDVQVSETTLTEDPLFSADGVTPAAASPAHAAAQGAPAEVSPNTRYAELPPSRAPRVNANGTTTRATASDLGAVPSAP